MKHLTDSVRASIRERNHYAAIMTTLTLPDICGSIDAPGTKNRDRYLTWFRAYVEPRFTRERVEAGVVKPHALLAALDCYALRCAYLHQGETDITGQAARVDVDRIVFNVSSAVQSADMVPGGAVLHIGVAEFCEEVCGGVDRWLAVAEADPERLARLEALPKIVDLDGLDRYVL